MAIVVVLHVAFLLLASIVLLQTPTMSLSVFVRSTVLVERTSVVS